MSDSSGASVADDAETRDSSDYEVLHDDKLKDTINNFLKDDSDCDSSYETPRKKKNDRFPIETIKDAGSQSERSETEISADDVRDIVSEESRGSEFSRSNDEYRRQRTNRLSSRSESDSNGGCSDVSTKSRNKKSEKNMKLCQKSSYRENKSSYDNSKLFRGEKSLTSDKKKHHSSQSHSSSKKLQQDGSKLKKHQHSLSQPNDRKSFTNVGQQLSRSDKSVREKVKAGVEDRSTPIESKGTKSRAVDVRDVWSEDSRTSELSDNSASNGSCQGGGAQTLSIASRISDDERSSPCNSTSSHDFNQLQRKDLKTSSDSDRKSRLDAVTSSHHTKQSGASVDRSRQSAKSRNHEEKSIHSKSKSQDSRLDFNEKKLHHGDIAPRGSNGKQPPGCGKSIKKEDVPTKTSQSKTGTKARSATRKTAETDNSTDGFNEILSENSRTSDLWAGFALGDWGHGRATDRLSIASNSEVDEVSSLCGSAESRGKLRTKELKKSSDAASKLRHDDKKSHHSDKSRESDKKSRHSDKLHTTDKKSHHSSNDKSQPGSKSLNSSSKESLGAERPAVKDESILNTGGLQKSPRGLSFFSSSKNAPYVTHSSTSKAPNVKTTAVSHKTTSKTDAATHVDDSPPVFTKVKINGFRVFIDKTLRTDPKLWQLLDVTLVNCDHVLAASLAKQRETLARKTEWKRENENDAGKILVNKHTSSSKSRQSDDHMRQKSFDKTRPEGSDGHKQSNNKKSSKDSNKKSKDRSKSQGESRLLDSSISRSPLASDIRHESKSHNSRKELHERKSNSGSKSQRESESNQSSKSQRESESNNSKKRDSESNSIGKSQRERESNQSSESQRERESNQSSKFQRESECNSNSKSQREESNQSSKSQRESESNSSDKSQRESEFNSNSKSQREKESNQSCSKSQRESESNNSCKSQCEIESNSIGKSQRERESNSISKSQRESESKNSKKSKRESESKNSSKSQHESESNQSSNVQREGESNSKSKSQLEKESNVSIKSQRESESNSNSKSQRESEPNISSKSQQDRKSNQSSKPQCESEPNICSKSQQDRKSNQSSKSQCESEPNISSKSQQDRKSNQSSKSQRENHSNHRSNSQHGSESQQTGKSHSKIKSNQSDRSHHDSKSSSLESKSLSRSVLNSNELQPSPSGSLADKELKIKESKSQSSFRAEGSLHDKSNQNCRKKTTADVKTAAEQLKPTKKRINIFQSDSDDDSSTIDSKENTMKKEQLVFKEDSKPVCDSSKHEQIVADDLSLLSSDEKSKDDILPEKEQHQNASELKAYATTEEHSDADDSSSRHDETADIEHASTDTCSASVKTEINDSVSEGLVKQAELESAKEISVPSSDAPLELRKSEENSATDLEDIKKKPESDQCSDLTKTDETDQPSVCQTTCRSDMSDGKDVDHLKSELSDDPQFSKASGLSELDQITSDDKDEDSVTVVQDLRGAGDCVMPREGLQSSNSDNGLVPSIEHASSVVSTEAATKVSGTEPVTQVSGTEPVTKVLGKVPVCAQSYNLEEVKKDVRLQPFVKLKILDEAVLKKLLSDLERSVRRKSLDTAAAKVVSSLALDSVTHSRSSSSSSSSGRSEIKDRCMDKNMPPTGDKEVKENKKRSISSSDDISAAEPPARRLKVESDVKSELVNSDKKKESGSALPETIAKSLQKAKAEFKRKGGFPSEMVRDDVKKRKTDADRNIAGMESWMRGGRDDKKMNSLSFVIPKVKSEQKADRVKKKKPQERPEKVWLPPPTAIPVPRIPKPAPLPKTLTEEDKGRSVLAKLEDTAGESENLRWQTNDSNYRGKNAVRASNWQPFNSMDDRGKRFGPQEGPHRRNCSPGMPIDVVNGSTGSSRFQRWNAGSNTGNPRNPSDTPFGGSSSNTPRLPAPSRWHGAQPPTHSVTNEKGGSSSSDWVRLYNRDPLRLEDPSAADECSAAFSPPAVADDEDDDIPNDRTITPRKVSTDDGDNMVENVKVLAEAIQEVLVEGTISSGRRDKLVDIYAKLQRDLNLTSDMQQGNVSLLNAFCGSTNQTLMSVDMFKDLLQHGSTPSQPDSASTLLNLPPSANESARNDFALMAARDFDFRDGSRVPMGYQDVDHRRIDVRCNPVRSFEKMVLSSTPVSSLSSPRGSVTGKSDSAYGSHPLPISTTGASRSAASHGGRGFRIDPNATFMDIDERNKCSQDIDERSAWARTTTERELAIPVITNVMRGLDVLQTSHDSDSLRQSTTGVDARKTVLAQERTVENSNTPTVFGSPRTTQPDGIKTVEKVEVPKSKETLRQEAIASRIEDELQLLEMLVTIQCELAEVSPLPETLSETDVVTDPTPVPEQALNTSDTIPSGVSSAVSNSPMCAGSVRSPVAEEASQDSTTQLSCKATPQQKADDEPKAADSAKAVEDRVISLARNALKPFYHKSQITSEEFKLIMRKAIAKIKVRDGEELKESKVSQLINAYVENIIRRRKKVSL